MKATGIVRRIDDLGRVVIPKEIRRTMRIREGDPLEIFTDRDGEVIFKKYSPMGELSSYAAEICESLYKSTGGTVAVCDRANSSGSWPPGSSNTLRFMPSESSMSVPRRAACMPAASPS